MKIIRHLDPQGRITHSELQADGTALLLKGDLFNGLQSTGKKAEVTKLLAPLNPIQIIAIGLNYRRHATEMNSKFPEHPILFFKSISSLQNPEDPILLPRHLRSDRVDYECELAVVIGRDCKNVSASKAFDYVAGYTCANDVSARDWQKNAGGGQWCRGKTFDSFCPIGPCLVTPDEIPDPQNLKIRTLLNGEAVQDWSTNDMIFNVAQIIEFLSGSTTLPAGTVILTGTPGGAGHTMKPPVYLKAGDVVSVPALAAPLPTGDDAMRAAVAAAVAPAGAAVTTVVLDQGLAGDEAGRSRLANVTAALSNRIRTLPPNATVGLWTFDGADSRPVVTTGPLSDDLGGQTRSAALTSTLDGLAPTGGGAVSFTTLPRAYTDALANYRPGPPNSILVITQGPHTDRTLDGPGLQNYLTSAADPNRPVTINVIDFGGDPDRPVWEEITRLSGGSYQEVATSDSPDLLAAIARMLS